MRLDPNFEAALPGPNHSVLDLGCGDGDLLQELIRRSYRLLVGVDKRIAGALIHPCEYSLNLIERDAIEYLTSNEMPYACIVMWDVLEHIPRKDVPKLLGLTMNNLTHDGTLILHLPNAEGLFGSRILHSDLTHRWAYTPQLITALLHKAGFQDVQIHECRPIVHGSVSFLRYCVWSVISAVGRFVLAVETGQYNGVLSQNMLVVARKACAA